MLLRVLWVVPRRSAVPSRRKPRGRPRRRPGPGGHARTGAGGGSPRPRREVAKEVHAGGREAEGERAALYHQRLERGVLLRRLSFRCLLLAGGRPRGAASRVRWIMLATSQVGTSLETRGFWMRRGRCRDRCRGRFNSPGPTQTRPRRRPRTPRPLPPTTRRRAQHSAAPAARARQMMLARHNLRSRPSYVELKCIV